MDVDVDVDIITTFYTAFAKRDAAGMAACYADDATFSDPVFPGLDADGVRKMWRMLCERGKDLELTFSDVLLPEGGGTTGQASAKWVATYTFSATGRKVENRISATFELRDGLITRHVDDFSFKKWSRQALGPIAYLLGWTGILQKKVRGQAAKNLEDFVSRAS